MGNWGFLIFAVCFIAGIWWLTRLMTSTGRDEGGMGGGPAGPAGM